MKHEIEKLNEQMRRENRERKKNMHVNTQHSSNNRENVNNLIELLVVESEEAKQV